MKRRVVDDGRPSDMTTGFPLETDEEFRARISAYIEQSVAEATKGAIGQDVDSVGGHKRHLAWSHETGNILI